MPILWPISMYFNQYLADTDITDLQRSRYRYWYRYGRYWYPVYRYRYICIGICISWIYQLTDISVQPYCWAFASRADKCQGKAWDPENSLTCAFTGHGQLAFLTAQYWPNFFIYSHIHYVGRLGLHWDRHVRQENSANVEGGQATSSRVHRRGARTHISLSGS
jgi:hypothetical protein